MQATFSALYPASRSYTGAGVLIDAMLSPGDPGAPVIDEEEGMLPPSILRQRGWPIPEDEEDPDPREPPVFTSLPTLPWLGSLSIHEAADLLTIDGFERAPELVIEPECSAPLWGASWRGGFHLQPGAWLAASLSIMEAPSSSGMGRYGGVYLGLRRLSDAEAVAVAVLPHTEAGRLGLRRLLDLDDDSIAAALSDRLTGIFR